MHRDHLSTSWAASWAAVLCALCASACASSASNLKPAAIAKGKGAIFGRVIVTNKGENITEECDVHFGGDDEARKAQTDKPPQRDDPYGGMFSGPSGAPGQAGSPVIVSLDETGWIFTTVNTGPTYLKQVSCSLGGMSKFPVYRSSDLQFPVHGGDRIAYFGNVVVDADYDDSSGAVAAGVLLGGAVGGLIASIAAADRLEHGSAQAEVANRFDDAVGEYQLRFGREGAALKPYASIAGGGLHAAGDPPPSPDPPEAMAGFAFGKDIGAAMGRCSGDGLEWQELGEGRFWCSGAPADLGVPVTVKLAACGGVVCEIAMNAGSDGAGWSTLVERFNTLSRRFDAAFGSPHQRRLDPLGDCTDGPEACFDAGRARRSALWRWPGGRNISLWLDGGAREDAPWLRVVYGTAAPPGGKP